MTPEDDTKRTTLRLPTAVYEAAIEGAKARNRSLNQYVAEVLFDGMSRPKERLFVEQMNKNQLLGFVSGSLLSVDISQIDCDGVSHDDAEKVVYGLVDYFRSMGDKGAPHMRSSSPDKNPTDDS